MPRTGTVVEIVGVIGDRAPVETACGSRPCQRRYRGPELDLVVVFTSSNMAEGTLESAGEPTEGPPIVDWLLGDFVLPACDTYELAEYADFGFSLATPQIVSAYPQPWIGSDGLSNRSGFVSFSYFGSPFVGAGVQWQLYGTGPSRQILHWQHDSGWRFLLQPVGADGCTNRQS